MTSIDAGSSFSTTAPATKRTELAAYLKACRARITPEAVGLPPGPRRRTPGLRREEVAQLAGVGVTWYTWLEQGRPIRASEQVVDAIARTLKLNGAERTHLFRLAEVRPTSSGPIDASIPAEIQTVLDSIQGVPANVISSRFDILAHNAAYAALFPGVIQPGARRNNTIWCLFTIPACCNPFIYLEDEMHRLVAMLRGNYGRHIGEPEWEGFIADLRAASPRFDELWGKQLVAAPTSVQKVFRHAAVGEIRMSTTSFSLIGAPELRMVTYLPSDPQSAENVAYLLANPTANPVDHTH